MTTPNEVSDTFSMPPHGFTCFHCGETFHTIGSAQDHFGKTPASEPGCVIKVKYGDERGLLMDLRKAEAELDRYRREDSDADRAMHTMRAQHNQAMIREEEKGYARGLKDGMAITTQELEKCNDHA